MASTACLVCFISTVNGRSKKRENALEEVVLVAGTQQNLGNLYSLDICDFDRFIDKEEGCFLFEREQLSLLIKIYIFFIVLIKFGFGQ